ncbi:prepilin peptidase [Lactococcus petauri]|uniref:prepilin peptidase n=1 Tax=Lactococcus petauri TaxID=1940789 RepID=UPI0032E3F099
MLIFYFIIGTIFGSFLGLVSERWGTEASIIFGRSQCSSCQKVLKWWQLLPLISQFIFKSRCAFCGEKFSYSYFILEFLTGILFGALWFDLDLIHFLTLSISLLLSKFDIDTYSYPLNIGLGFTACFFYFLSYQSHKLFLARSCLCFFFYQYWDWCWRLPLAFLGIFFCIFRRNTPTYPNGLCVWPMFFTH